jgi:hypothetical protein
VAWKSVHCGGLDFSHVAEMALLIWGGGEGGHVLRLLRDVEGEIVWWGAVGSLRG